MLHGLRHNLNKLVAKVLYPGDLEEQLAHSIESLKKHRFNLRSTLADHLKGLTELGQHLRRNWLDSVGHRAMASTIIGHGLLHKNETGLIPQIGHFPEVKDSPIAQEQLKEVRKMAEDYMRMFKEYQGEYFGEVQVELGLKSKMSWEEYLAMKRKETGSATT